MYKTVYAKYLLIMTLSVNALATSADSLTVDYSFAPAKWQSTICMPDDPEKTLVNQDGTLCLDHIGCFTSEGVREFNIYAKVIVNPNAKKTHQRMLSAKIPIVQTVRETKYLHIVEDAFSLTDTAKKIESAKNPEDVLRDDVILVHVANKTKKSQVITPRLIIDRRTKGMGRLPDHKLKIIDNRFIKINTFESAHSTHPLSNITIEKHGDHNDAVMTLAALNIPPQGRISFALVYHRDKRFHSISPTIESVLASRKRAVEFWTNANLPWGCIEVPDAGIQNLIDASIRNIWQTREIKNGLPAFQVGPTVYRGLWVVDGAFILETATMLGAVKEARAGLYHLLSFQKPDGSFELNKMHWKENGIVIWACTRHAMLTQDKDWLRSVWPKLEKTYAAILNLKKQTYTNNTPLDDGLIPPGFPDGGLGSYHIPEYTNVYWTLIGMKTAVQAAQWLGKNDQADQWQNEYDEMYTAFRKAARRDQLKDAFGNVYVPTYMGRDGKKILPQRAQWAFCHAVYPGRIFEKTDPLITGNLAMLEKTEREGLVYGTGWNEKGLWNYFASFYGHARLWQGNTPKAVESLYAFANHASPLYVWREEQNLKEDTYRRVGDMPHNWASAEFIRLTAHLLAIDRGNELHLLESLPREWTKPGMKTTVRKMYTPFGQLSFSFQISGDGKQGQLNMEQLKELSCENIVVHLDRWAAKSATGKYTVKSYDVDGKLAEISKLSNPVWKSTAKNITKLDIAVH